VGDVCLSWGAAVVLTGGASVPPCHAQNGSLEETRSQPQYVLPASVCAGSARGCSRGSAGPGRGLLGWAVVRGTRAFLWLEGLLGEQGGCTALGEGHRGPSTARGLEGRDPRAAGLGARRPAQAPAQPRLHFPLKHLSCPWFPRVGDRHRVTLSGIFDGCPAGLGVPGHGAATATAPQPRAAWVVCPPSAP